MDSFAFLLLDQHVKAAAGDNSEPAFYNPELYEAADASSSSSSRSSSGSSAAERRREEQLAAYKVLQRQARSLKTHPDDAKDVRAHLAFR